MLKNFKLARRAKSALRTFGISERGVAAVEFALVVPFLLTLFIGIIELSRYMGLLRRVQNASVDIGLALSASNQEITGSDLWNLYSMAPTLIHDVRADMKLSGQQDWWQVARVNASFIRVQSSVPGCVNCNNAEVVWTYGVTPRACGTVGFGNLEKDLPPAFRTHPTNLVSVEISYSYQPFFATFLKGMITVDRVFLVPPKHSDTINVTKLGEAAVKIGKIC